MKDQTGFDLTLKTQASQMTDEMKAQAKAAGGMIPAGERGFNKDVIEAGSNNGAVGSMGDGELNSFCSARPNVGGILWFKWETKAELDAMIKALNLCSTAMVQQ